MVNGSGDCSCMLLLDPILTIVDAGPDLCILCPDLCNLHPDLWTWCLWCFPSFNWCKHSTCTGGDCHQLQLALVVLFHSATSADSPLAHVVLSLSATCAGGAFHPDTGINTALAPGQLEVTKERHKRKFDKLLTEQSHPQSYGSRTVVNLSTKQLDESHILAVSKGLNFAPAPKKVSTAYLVTTIEAAIRRSGVTETMAGKTRVSVIGVAS